MPWMIVAKYPARARGFTRSGSSPVRCASRSRASQAVRLALRTSLSRSATPASCEVTFTAAVITMQPAGCEGSAYSATKSALDNFTLTLAKDLGPRGITVNSVAPGIIDTDINADWLRDDPEAQEHAASLAALGRVGQPEDVADIVAFLASDDSRWVTGTVIDATGVSGL